MSSFENNFSHLKLEKDGIWYSKESNYDLSYNVDGNSNCFAVEDSSFWFSHRNSCIEQLIKAHDHKSLLDIGGGNGYVSLNLQKSGFDVCLLEPGKVGASNAKNRGVKNVICSTLQSANFEEKSVSAAGLFDVLEHIEDDLGFLKDIHRVLQKDGNLFITVPAYNMLWSNNDVTAGHYRRYTIDSLSEVVEKAGFELEFASYFFSFLIAPVFLFRSIPSKLGLVKMEDTSKRSKKQHKSKKSIFSKVVGNRMESELKRLSKLKRINYGTSLVAVIKKK